MINKNDTFYKNYCFFDIFLRHKNISNQKLTFPPNHKLPQNNFTPHLIPGGRDHINRDPNVGMFCETNLQDRPFCLNNIFRSNRDIHSGINQRGRTHLFTPSFVKLRSILCNIKLCQCVTLIQ